MLVINLKSTDPYFNLAVDEYLLKKSKEDFLVIGINDSSVIIGKHQVAHKETDTKFVTEHNIPVIRRISGGGTVFHDKGNLNFSFILNSEYGKQVDFLKYSRPVLSFLSSIGVDAKFEGKNDLKINGFKISGNAEHVHHDRVLHHGTLLYSSDLELLKSSLRTDTTKYNSRAVTSNPSSVININYVVKYVDNYVDKYVDSINGFRTAMVSWFLENIPGSESVELTQQQVDEISLLSETKYRTWEWNYAYGPEYKFDNNFEFDGSFCSCSLSVNNGIITRSEIRCPRFPVSFAGKLIGCRHMIKDINDVLLKEDLLHSGFDVYNFF